MDLQAALLGHLGTLQQMPGLGHVAQGCENSKPQSPQTGPGWQEQVTASPLKMGISHTDSLCALGLTQDLWYH